MKPSEILRAAKAKIENPKHWTQGAYYRDENGHEAYSMHHGVCFCSYGALRVANNRDTDYKLVGAEYLWKAIEMVSNGSEVYSIDQYNDSHSHSEVMAMWDRAIELAEAEEKE